MPLDTTDRRILNLLQEDGRMTNARLAEEVAISPSATLERVRRLERLRVILGYRAIANPETVDCGTSAFVAVSLAAHEKQALEVFESRVREFPEVTACYHVAGGMDFLLKVVVKDIPAYREFVVKRLSRLPNIGHVETSFVLDTVKETTALPIPEPEG
jgi:Lrp/AsnC family leucine-responsive transcriptional regulator